MQVVLVRGRLRILRLEELDDIIRLALHELLLQSLGIDCIAVEVAPHLSLSSDQVVNGVVLLDVLVEQSIKGRRVSTGNSLGCSDHSVNTRHLVLALLSDVEIAVSR